MKLPLRWLLPIGHTLINGLLLAVLYGPYADQLSQTAGVFILNAQPAGTFNFDLKQSTACFHPPAAFLLLVSGNLPAELVASRYYFCPHVYPDEMRAYLLIHVPVSVVV